MKRNDLTVRNPHHLHGLQVLNSEPWIKLLLMVFIAVMLVLTARRYGPDFIAWRKQVRAETPVVYKSNTAQSFRFKLVYPDGRIKYTNEEPERSDGEYVPIQ